MRLSLVAGMVIVAIGFWQRCRPGCGGRMKRERFSEEQIIAVLREHEAGGKTGDLARKYGVSEATLYNWDAVQLEGQVRRHGRVRGQAAEGAGRRGPEAAEAAGRVGARHLGAEGAALKKMAGSAAKREAAAHLRSSLEMSERRAWSLAAADRTMVRYRSRRLPDTALRARLRELANERRRFGYRRLFVLLQREGERSGINRIYREERLTVRKRRTRRRAAGTRCPILAEAKVNA